VRGVTRYGTGVPASGVDPPRADNGVTVQRGRGSLLRAGAQGCPSDDGAKGDRDEERDGKSEAALGRLLNRDDTGGTRPGSIADSLCIVDGPFADSPFPECPLNAPAPP
jgi:hypothetical protein